MSDLLTFKHKFEIEMSVAYWRMHRSLDEYLDIKQAALADQLAFIVAKMQQGKFDDAVKAWKKLRKHEEETDFSTHFIVDVGLEDDLMTVLGKMLSQHAVKENGELFPK